MCLITKEPSQVAQEDITCYKVVNYVDDNKVLSFYLNFEYILNKLYETNLLPIHNQDGDICIENGFHSYRTIHRAIKNLVKYLQYKEYGCVVVECIIPKGAIFFQNDKYFASNQIIIKTIIQ